SAQVIDAVGVVAVTMGDDDELDLPHDGRDPLGVREVVGPGVHHHAGRRPRRPQDDGVGPLEGHLGGVVAEDDPGQLRDGPEGLVRREGDRGQACGHRGYPSTSTTSSTSTGAFSGSSDTPTADRAWTPASPKISPSTSEAPLRTPGCPLKPGAEATNPTTLTAFTT